MSAVIDSGEIVANASYTLDEFSRRTGLKRDAIRAARHNGLIVTRRHNRAYVLGKHWLEYLEGSEQAGDGQEA